jgi:hypothetical protein
VGEEYRGAAGGGVGVVRPARPADHRQINDAGDEREQPDEQHPGEQFHERGVQGGRFVTGAAPSGGHDVADDRQAVVPAGGLAASVAARAGPDQGALVGQPPRAVVDQAAGEQADQKDGDEPDR